MKVKLDPLSFRLLIAAAVVAVAWQTTIAFWPISPDAGVFLWIADVVASGGSAYRDAAEVKFPFAWLPLRWLVPFTGSSGLTVRLLDLIAFAFGVAVLFRSGAMLQGKQTGALAVLLYATMQWGLDFHSLGQPEAWVGVMGAATFLLMLSQYRLRFVLAGILVALSASVKPYFLIVALVAVPHMIGYGSIEFVRRAAAFGAGLLTTLGAMAFYLASTEGLRPLLDIVSWAQLVYAERLPLTTRVGESIRSLASPPFSMLLPFSIAGPFVLWSARRHRDAWSLCALLVGMVVVVAIQGKFWAYHWLPLFAASALSAAISLVALVESQAGNTHPMSSSGYAYAIGASVFLVTALPGARNALAFGRAIVGDMSSYQRERFETFGDHSDGINQVVRDLGASGPETRERVLIYGYYLGAYPLNGLRAPTRLANLRYVYDGADMSIREEYRREFMQQIARVRPEYWIVPSAKASNWRIEGFPEACRYLAANYELEARRGEFAIYRLLSGSAGRSTAKQNCPH